MAQNGNKNDSLTAKQLRTIEALLREPTITAAARAAKGGQRTIFTWLNDPLFASAYRRGRSQIVEKAISELQSASSDAVLALKRNLKCGVPAVEVNAAKTILDQATKGIELSDLVEQVEQLKSLVDSLLDANRIKKCA